MISLLPSYLWSESLTDLRKVHIVFYILEQDTKYYLQVDPGNPVFPFIRLTSDFCLKSFFSGPVIAYW